MVIVSYFQNLLFLLFLDELFLIGATLIFCIDGYSISKRFSDVSLTLLTHIGSNKNNKILITL